MQMQENTCIYRQGIQISRRFALLLKNARSERLLLTFNNAAQTQTLALTREFADCNSIILPYPGSTTPERSNRVALKFYNL